MVAIVHHMKEPKLSGHDQRRICVDAPCDPRTLRKYLRGEAVRPLANSAIARALRKLGRPDLVQALTTTTSDAQ